MNKKSAIIFMFFILTGILVSADMTSYYGVEFARSFDNSTYLESFGVPATKSLTDYYAGTFWDVRFDPFVLGMRGGMYNLKVLNNILFFPNIVGVPQEQYYRIYCLGLTLGYELYDFQVGKLFVGAGGTYTMGYGGARENGSIVIKHDSMLFSMAVLTGAANLELHLGIFILSLNLKLNLLQFPISYSDRIDTIRYPLLEYGFSAGMRFF